MDKSDSTIQQQQPMVHFDDTYYLHLPIIHTENECVEEDSELNQSFEVIERESDCFQESFSSSDSKKA